MNEEDRQVLYRVDAKMDIALDTLAAHNQRISHLENFKHFVLGGTALVSTALGFLASNVSAFFKPGEH